MQETNAIPHSVGQVVYALVVFFSGSAGGGLLIHLLGRRRLNLESEANAAKAKAEARHLDSETIDKAYERIEQLHDIIDELRAQQERDRLEILRMSHVEYISQQQRAEIERCRIELELGDKQMKRLKGLLDAHGIRPSDLDAPKC